MLGINVTHSPKTCVVSIDIRTLVLGTINKYAEMGAPEQDVAESRQRADALLESMNRLLDWRKTHVERPPREAD